MGRIGTARLRHAEDVISLAVSPDGAILASGTYDMEKEVRVWDTKTGKQLYRLVDGGGFVAISPDGTTLATSGEGTAVFLFDLQTGKEIRRIKVESTQGKPVQGLWQIAFSPNGRLLAVASWYEVTRGMPVYPRYTTIRLLNPATGEQLSALSAPDDAGYGFEHFAFSPDSSKIALIGGKEHTVYVWEVPSGKLRSKIAKSALWCGFAADARSIIVCEPRALRLFNLDDQKLTRTIADLPNKQGDETSCVAISADGKLLATCGRYFYSKTRVFEVASGRVVRELPEGLIRALAFSPDGKTLVSGWNIIRLWDISSGKERVLAETPRGKLWCAVFSPDGKNLAVCGGTKGVRLIDISSRNVVQHFGEESWVRSVAFSPDGKSVAMGGQYLDVRDTASGRLIHTFKGHTLALAAVAFSSETQTLFSASYDGTVRHWDIRTGKEIRQLRHGQKHDSERVLAVEGLVLFPNGERLATLAGQSVWIWDLQAGQVAHEFKGVNWNGPCGPLALSPNGNMLAFEQYEQSRAGSVLQEVAPGKEPRPLLASKHGLRGHWGLSFAFSRDGRLLATGGADNTVRVWDVATGKELVKFVGHEDRVAYVAFSPDGLKLASASWDSTVLIWDLSRFKNR